jgi:hypothetical protein
MNGRSTGNGADMLKGTTTRIMVATRPKVSFHSHGNIGPVNYG